MLTQNNFFVEKCGFVADDATAKKRKEIAERLRNGRPVDIEGNNGEMKTSEDAQTSAGPKLKVDKDKLAADDAAAKKRKEIAERLRNGRPVDIEGNNGEMKTSEDAQTSAGPKLKVDKDKLAADDAAAKKRKEIAERLRNGRIVEIKGNNGEMKTSEDAQTSAGPKLKVDKDKLAAAFYWYEKDRDLYNAEVEAMKVFPNFRLEKLDDDRLCWIGNLNPNGKSGGTWTIMAVYDHNHPHNNTYGGSVKVYSVKPDLNELYAAAGKLPHVLQDSNGSLYMCTARPQDVLVGKVSTSAATHIGHAVKWIKLVEDWLEGIIGDEVFAETY